MAKVSKEEFSQSKPVVKPEDLGGASHSLVTINDAQKVKFDDRNRIVLRFDEFPEHNYFPNKTSIDRLIDGLGDEMDDWNGEQIPLEVVQTTHATTHKPMKALWVSDPEDWSSLKKQFRQQSGGAKVSGKARGRPRKA
jgi:hypothetical protein